MAFPFPHRTIHLDFHTGTAIEDVGELFNPDEFASTFQAAHVDSVTVFAKCHHGHLYYDTERPERHPGLRRDLDLMGKQIESLRRRGIRAPVYISVQCDEWAANTHPEWQVIAPDGKIGNRDRLAAGWQILDMSSPYQEFLTEQIDEVLRKYAPLDGLFLDMCWDQPSLSKWAIDGMRRAGLDPREPADRQTYARQVALGYMDRYKRMLDEAQRGHDDAGIWFNSRPKTNLDVEKQYLRHVEIECLPTGGWGYAYFPYVARFVRPFGLPTLSHTGRFHRSWGDFGTLKPEAALLYECASILSLGITNGIGDQLHPRGKPDAATYEQIGRVYGHIKACERYVKDGKLRSQVGVIIDPARGDHASDDGLGVIRSLQQLRCQFDLLPPHAELSAYELVIVPDSIKVGEGLKRRLIHFLSAGGALLLSGDAGRGSDGAPLLEEQGIEIQGESPFTSTYLRPLPGFDAAVPHIDHVMYERGYRMTAASGAEPLCSIVEPYFERSYEHFCSHSQTPADRESPFHAVAQKGKVITISVPLFTAYGRYANIPYRQILSACLQRLLPRPLLRDNGPSHLEATVAETMSGTVVHLLSFCPVRRTAQLDIIEDAFPLVDLELAVRMEYAPRHAFLAPDGDPLPLEYLDGYAHTRLTSTKGHAMVLFEG